MSIDIKGGSITSLCHSIGQTVTGKYTIGETQYSVEAVCGPCSSGGCLGQCGVGCNGPPRFTQECFNHDLCVGATGTILRPCLDEFMAAAPGFFFAPYCFCNSDLTVA